MDIWDLGKIKAELEKAEIATGREAASLSRWILEDILEVKSGEKRSAAALQKFDHTLRRLREGIPVQYIAGYAWFFGEKFKVTPEVLIPRPETEELVDWIITDFKHVHGPLRILDIGTGSGCIAIMLKMKLGAKCTVTAIDISDTALEVAKTNSRTLGVEVSFRKMDYLSYPDFWDQNFDILVSNPPYIGKNNIDDEIIAGLQYEPDVALYPEGEDMDVFYRRISEQGHKSLNSNGVCYLEINEFRTDEISALFGEPLWKHSELRKDMQGVDRMLKICKGK